MADVFLSYASEDRDRVQPIIDRLSGAGWNVWWDRSVEPGHPWADVIDRELERARCVVVVWSGNAIDSPWVRLEANRARARHNLVPVALEPVQVPAEFANLQQIDLSGSGDPLAELERSVALQVRRSVRPRRIVTLLALLALVTATVSGVCTLSNVCTIDRGTAADRSLAILPLQNRIADVQVSGIADAFIDEVRDTIAGVEGQQIASRSALRALPAAMTLPEIGSRLNVRWLITGEVAASPGGLTFALELIDARTGYLVANARRELAIDDLERGRDELAEQLLALVTGRPQELPDAPARPASAEAFVLYLTGKAVIREQLDDQRLANAERQFQLALAMQPAYPEAEAGLCTIHLWRYERSRSPADYATAESHCKAALQLRSRSADVAVALGNLYRYQGSHEAAAESFGQALRLEPSSAEALIGLGEVALARGDRDQAAQHLQAAVAAQPGYWRAHNALGVFLLETGRAADADRAFQQAIELSPAEAGMVTNLGISYAMLQNLPLAVLALQRALELEKSASAHNNLGTVYYWMNQFDNAAAQYQAAAELTPDDYRVWANLGDALHQIDAERARSAYATARDLIRGQLEINANDVDAWVGLAAASAVLGDPATTREVLSSNREALDDNPARAYMAAVAYARLNEFESAASLMQSATREGFPAFVIDVDPAFEQLRGRIGIGDNPPAPAAGDSR